MEISKLEKLIYNTYLKYYGLTNNRPFKIRKDFDNLTEENKLMLSKLALFFERNKNLDIDNYIKVVFQLKKISDEKEDKNNTFLKLDYFYNISTLRNYARHIETYHYDTIDNKQKIEDFKESLIFIKTFCNENNITVAEYKHSINECGVRNVLLHLSKNLISFYTLHFININLFDLDLEYIDMYVNNFKEKFKRTLADWQQSKLKSKLKK